MVDQFKTRYLQYIVPAVLAICSFAAGYGMNKEQLAQQEKRIEKLEANSVSRQELQFIIQRLDRIDRNIQEVSAAIRLTDQHILAHIEDTSVTMRRFKYQPDQPIK